MNGIKSVFVYHLFHSFFLICLYIPTFYLYHFINQWFIQCIQYLFSICLYIVLAFYQRYWSNYYIKPLIISMFLLCFRTWNILFPSMKQSVSKVETKCSNILNAPINIILIIHTDYPNQAWRVSLTINIPYSMYRQWMDFILYTSYILLKIR